MALTQIVVLAVVQGITEFLPISSSGHLILVPIVADWPDQGLLLDVAVHVGTLGAVMIYFWQDLFAMVNGVCRLLIGRRDPGARLAGQVLVATIPVLGAGYLFDAYIGDGLRSIEIIGWATLGFGLLLYAADRMSMTVKKLGHSSYLDVLVIGVAQIFALIPGTSRSGITITAARFLGFERAEAARFSMLLSIPTIAASGLWLGLNIYEADDLALTRGALVAAGLSFVTAIISIAALMAWLQRSSFTPFVIYRVILGITLLAFTYGWI
ncbi:MAG: undecaprenyl-diphosphate phosphatase [Rhodospirillaceae bacterium]|nr:undecaprenyl-diphosphate phosphatase [Rhodospirillaceae bacterium]